MHTILLIGKRAQILDQLKILLENEHMNVILTSDLENLTTIDASTIDVVMFGRALSSEQQEALQAVYQKKNPTLQCISGLAPIPQLLAAQVKSAATHKDSHQPTNASRSGDSKAIEVSITNIAQLNVTVWWLTVFYHAKSQVVVDSTYEPGNYVIDLPKKLQNKRSWIVVSVGESTYVI